MSTAAAFPRRIRVTTAPTVALPGPGMSSKLRRIATAGGDALTLLGVVFAIPFVILAIGIPIALVVQLVLWVGRSL